MLIKVFGLELREIRSRLGHLAEDLSISMAGAEAAIYLPDANPEIVAALADHIYGADVPSLQHVCVELLHKFQKKVAVAESCTGGLLASRLTSIPGSSEVFELGMVTYANWVKHAFLEVPEAVLENFGAVSWQTARAMAAGVRRAAHADFGLSTTGIAGPGGGTVEKPVGLVYAALATAHTSFVMKLDLGGLDRQQVQASVCNYSLDILRRYLEKKPIPFCMNIADDKNWPHS